jgi:hypothetical protein
MPRRTLTVTALTVAALTVAALTVAAGANATASQAPLRTRPDRADWAKIQAAAQFRRIGLARDRTAHFRAYAGALGLSELATIHPLAPGRCRLALTYLHGNLRDLQDAQPGENWTPLRRLVAREPSIHACAPRRAKPPHT